MLSTQPIASDIPTARMANAPQKPMNDLMRDRVQAAERAIATLARYGFTVIGLRIEQGARPTIQIAPGKRCAQLVADARAGYYIRRQGPSGPERLGQFQVEDCRVIWLEAGR